MAIVKGKDLRIFLDGNEITDLVEPLRFTRSLGFAELMTGITADEIRQATDRHVAQYGWTSIYSSTIVWDSIAVDVFGDLLKRPSPRRAQAILLAALIITTLLVYLLTI